MNKVIKKKKLTSLQLRHKIIRKKISGTLERPRLCFHKSNKRLIAQLIDDNKGATLAYAFTTGKNKDSVKILANDLAKKAKAKKIEKVVFDRGGHKYIGNVKLFADICREKGLKF